jgi:hypothetical protein
MDRRNTLTKEIRALEGAVRAGMARKRRGMAAAGDEYLQALKDAKARANALQDEHLNKPYMKTDAIGRSEVQDRLSSLIGLLHSEIVETSREQNRVADKELRIKNQEWSTDLVYTLEVTDTITRPPEGGTASNGVLEGRVNGKLTDTIGYKGEIVSFTASAGPAPSDVVIEGDGAASITYTDPNNTSTSDGSDTVVYGGSTADDTKELRIINNGWSADLHYRMTVSGEITTTPANGVVSGSTLDGKVDGLFENVIGYTGQITSFTVESGPGAPNIEFEGDEASRLSYSGLAGAAQMQGPGFGQSITTRGDEITGKIDALEQEILAAKDAQKSADGGGRKASTEAGISPGLIGGGALLATGLSYGAYRLLAGQ